MSDRSGCEARQKRLGEGEQVDEIGDRASEDVDLGLSFGEEGV